MPRNGNGIYNLPQAAFTPNTTISSSAVNSDFSDIATALTNSIANDGQTPITGVFKFLSGSLATPSVSFTADTTTGLALNATFQLLLAANSLGAIVNGTAYKASAAPTVSAAGSGYVVGDVITLTGGINPIAVTVATLSGSGVATVTLTEAGRYITQPANPIAQASTTGVGTGATFTVTWATVLAVTDQANATLWGPLGASSYMASVMTSANALALANNIGSANIAAAVQTSLPVPKPEGYLTTVSNTPIITSDSTSATTVYYTPLNGLWTPVHNGTTIIPYQLVPSAGNVDANGQLVLNMSGAAAGWSANNIYDVFLFYNAGVPLIGTGPTWTGGAAGSITPGSCARGTGAGGTALSRLLGFWVNAAQITLTYNLTGAGVNSTVTVPAHQGIYLGTFFVDSTNGQITCHRSFGQNRKFGLWNMYNRTTITLQAGDSTASWNYNTNTFRASNNVPASYTANNYNFGSGTAVNGLTPLVGQADQEYIVQFSQVVSLTAASNSGQSVTNGIGLNSTTAASGQQGQFSTSSSGASVGTSIGQPTAILNQVTPLGINNYTSLEKTSGNSNNSNWVGTSVSMTLQVNYLG